MPKGSRLLVSVIVIVFLSGSGFRLFQGAPTSIVFCRFYFEGSGVMGSMRVFQRVRAQRLAIIMK